MATGIIFVDVYAANSEFDLYDPPVQIPAEGTVLQVIRRAQDPTFGTWFLQIRRCGQQLDPQRQEWVMEDDVNVVSAPCP